jgi:hypothetical protein
MLTRSCVYTYCYNILTVNKGRVIIVELSQVRDIIELYAVHVTIVVSATLLQVNDSQSCVIMLPDDGI